MTETVGVTGTDLTQRVVLVGLAALDADGLSPAHAGEVRRLCSDRLDAVEGDVVGTLSGADVARPLKELETGSLVAGTRDATSVTGKGRPRYELVADREGLVTALDDDDRVGGLLDRDSA